MTKQRPPSDPDLPASGDDPAGKSAETRGIRVLVVARYLSGYSSRTEYVFSYEITIRNGSPDPVQLLRRHWVITDALGVEREVEGAGVIGQQPVIQPGTEFSYSSWATLPTTIGTMKGTYQMVVENGETFDLPIPEFILNADQTIH
jgi:ApaG protein